MKHLLFGAILLMTWACTEVEEDGLGNDAGMNAKVIPNEPPVLTLPQMEFPLEVIGVVVDENDAPVPEAWIMQGGRSEERILTGEDGSFTFVLQEPSGGLSVLVAAKMGYRAIGMEYFIPGEPVTLKIREIKAPDNEEYIYEYPGDGIDIEMEDCTHCHAALVRELLSSKHVESARSPQLQDLYAGVSRLYENQEACTNAGGQWRQGIVPGTIDTSTFKCYLGDGVLSDLNTNCGGEGQNTCDDPSNTDGEKPLAFGSCADCHAPGINGVAGGRNLHDATGHAYDLGVHCDVCHKVSDIDMTKPPGVGQRLVTRRPGEPGRNIFLWEPVYFGPLLDVPLVAMGGSYQPKFNESVFCAGCHQQEQPALLPNESLNNEKWPDGLPIHDTYNEWNDGPYAQERTACQFCHMPARFDQANATDLGTKENQSITFGFVRPPEDNRKHIFRSPLHGDPRLIDGALYTSIILTQSENTIHASVSIANVGCGHAVPTGEPMRALVMVVQAQTENCGELEPIGGMTLSDVGGMRAQGIEGEDVITAGATLTWEAGAAVAQVGQVIRVTRATGAYDNYTGINYFAGESLTPEQKGLPIHAPVGEAVIESVQGVVITIDAALSIENGDTIYLGDPWPETVADGDDARYLAGKAGYAFSKVLVDSSGRRHVPHYKAIDMLSDNRIPPGGRAITQHSFSMPDGCGSGEVTARIFYRPHPLSLAVSRGWESKDYLISSAAEALP